MMTFWMMSSSPFKIMIIFKKRGTDNFKIIKRNRKYYRSLFRAERAVWGKWRMNHLWSRSLSIWRWGLLIKKIWICLMKMRGNVRRTIPFWTIFQIRLFVSIVIKSLKLKNLMTLTLKTTMRRRFSNLRRSWNPKPHPVTNPQKRTNFHWINSRPKLFETSPNTGSFCRGTVHSCGRWGSNSGLKKMLIRQI